ncbi:NADH dehydrogenase [ubiquinone] 1 subunit C2-like [Babylonia areolata]|uniref:NADH dehydrogenase [ubiquinone] 1 subunit C2-like n=1 Tax=Babylonia areolata TaxID=304850 RepID=UPI003FD56909
MPTPITFMEFVGVCAGASFAVGLNMMQRKPILTGIYKHMAGGVVGYFIGQKVDLMNAESGRRKLLVIEDYIQQHPEDFVEEAPKTYGDVLLKWYPVR